MTTPAIEAFGAKWGFPPGSTKLLDALTHKSLSPGQVSRGERLEFFGDAVLGFTITKVLFERMPDTTKEGQLTRARIALVCKETLARAAQGLRLDSLILLGEHERRLQCHTFDRIMVDAYEAVIGALYLEKGLPAAERFILSTLDDEIEKVIQQKVHLDPKTSLQEKVQALHAATPVYKVVDHAFDGAEHTFRVEVSVRDRAWATGIGPNRRAAERDAASRALQGAEGNPS